MSFLTLRRLVKVHQNKLLRLASSLCLILLGCRPSSNENAVSTMQAATREALCAKNSSNSVATRELNTPAPRYQHKPIQPYDYSLLDIDIVFVIGTNASMGDEIAQIREAISSLIGQIKETTSTYRVAVVSYRDFPTRTGASSDYPARVEQIFTEDPRLIQNAIDSLSAQGGGDCQDAVFSGIETALELPWREAVARVIFVIGDAPAFSPEPISNLTTSQIVKNSIAWRVVQVIGIDVGSLNGNGALGQIAAQTGGYVVPGTSDLTNRLLETLDRVANQPSVWIGQAYSGKIGQPVQFSASGSYGPISYYEWDFDGDGVFDLKTQNETAAHIYDRDFNDYVIMRATGPEGSAYTSARTDVNVQGYAPQGSGWWDILRWLFK